MFFKFAVNQQAFLLQLHLTTCHIGNNQLDQHACLLELHLTIRYVWISCNWFASSSAVVGLNQQVYLLPLPLTHSYVPMLVPNQQAGKHNCTWPSDIYVTVAPDQQQCLYKLHTINMHFCYSFILSASMYIYLYPTISHVCNNCMRPFAMYFTVALNQQFCLLNLHLQACMSGTLATDQHSYLL